MLIIEGTGRVGNNMCVAMQTTSTADTAPYMVTATEQNAITASVGSVTYARVSDDQPLLIHMHPHE